MFIGGSLLLLYLIDIPPSPSLPSLVYLEDDGRAKDLFPKVRSITTGEEEPLDEGGLNCTYSPDFTHTLSLIRNPIPSPFRLRMQGADRKFFDSGDYAMSKAGKASSKDVGTHHPSPERIPHSIPQNLKKDAGPSKESGLIHEAKLPDAPKE